VIDAKVDVDGPSVGRLDQESGRLAPGLLASGAIARDQGG
jgi:hypothetical protein